MLSEEYKGAAEKIKKGGVGVLPTDTIYGLVGSALSQEAVEHIYQLKGRDNSKPFIILLSEGEDLNRFGIELDDFARKKLAELWPGPVSVVLPCLAEEYEYLHRGEKTLAFRVPDEENLRNFLEISGPLVAPSANPQDKKPARNIDEARKYFGEGVDFYIDGGDLEGSPSTLVCFRGKKVELLRQGRRRVK